MTRIIKLITITLVFAAFLIVGALTFSPITKEARVIQIKPGSTLSKLAYDWNKDGWLQSARAVLIVARLTGMQTVRPGEFEAPAEMTAYQLLTFLKTAQPKSYKVVFIEGTRVSDALKALANAKGVVQDIEPLTADNVRKKLNISGHIEGWLFPDTYVYYSGDKASSIVKQAYDRTVTVLEEEWANREEGLPYKNAYEALTMASIVEKETGQGFERPMIAGVFVRRLNKNMRMETDPTVIYGLGDSYQGNLRKKHLRDRSNFYNTYRHKGLPPSPIALAGREAINAALHPAEGDELYFVAKGDGTHVFSSNLKDHNKAVRKYQIFRRAKDYRSAPTK